MRLPQAFLGCKSVGMILMLLLIVVGTAYRRDFMQMLEEEETDRKQQWYKVNESHELWKIKDSQEGKLFQHLYPSLLT